MPRQVRKATFNKTKKGATDWEIFVYCSLLYVFCDTQDTSGEGKMRASFAVRGEQVHECDANC